MESEYGFEYDVSWEPYRKEDVIIIDAGDEMVTLSKSDLRDMLERLS